MAEDVFY